MCDNAYKILDDIVIGHFDIVHTFRWLLDKKTKDKETINNGLLVVLKSAIDENAKRYDALLTEIKKNVDNALPYEAITKIPNTQPDAIPELWNNTYREIDSNFQFIKNYLEKLEKKIENSQK